MTRSKRIQHLSLIGFVLLFLCCLLIFFIRSPFFAVSHSVSELHLEIGETLSQNPSDYLEGEDWCVALSYVDTSSVKQTKAGRYPIRIYHGFKKYTTFVNVLDTTAPVISCDVKNKTITAGDTISVHNLGLKIEDHSKIDSIAFTRISSSHFYTGLSQEKDKELQNAYRKGLDMYAEDFRFSYGGIYTLTICVTDIFQNSAETTLTLTVEQPPVLDVPADFYVAVGHTVEFDAYISAWDFIQEDLDASDVTIDASQLDLSKKGDYTVTFSATDDYGLSSSAAASVHVDTQNYLQQQINTHQIDISESVVIGAYQPYDSGYYENVPLADIRAFSLPSIVHIENDKHNTYGSGFILEITDEFITIATNEHVITDDLIVDVTFSNALTLEGSVVASNVREDISFIRIPIREELSAAAYPKDRLKELRTVHINKAYWNGLENDSYISFCYSCFDADAVLWIENEGYIVEKNAVRNWNTYTDIKETILSSEPVSGTSGSALFDECGRLIGMIRGYTEYDGYTETVAVPLERILDQFERVFKYRIEYQ